MTNLRLRSTDDLLPAEGLSSMYQNGRLYPAIWSDFGHTLGVKKVIIDQMPTPYKPGNLKVTVCDLRKFTCTATSDTVKFSNADNSFWNDVSGPIAAYNFAPQSSLSYGASQSDRLDDLATMKAFAKVQEPDVNLLENFAEAGKTLEMIVNPMRGLLRLVKDWRKEASMPFSSRLMPTRKAAHNIPKRMSDLWLQYRYGIMPLILSVQGLQKSYLRHFKEKTPWERKSGSYSDTTEQVLSAYTKVASGKFWWQDLVQSTTQVRRCYFYLSKDGLSKDLWSVGAHPYQYISLAWELVPASFMVDWSIGLGDWLKTITPAPHIVLLNSFISFRETTTTQRSCVSNENYYSACVADKVTTSMAFAEYTKYYRRPGLPSNPSTPVLDFNPLNIIRTVDTLSILGQQLLTKLR